jgi:transcriptional regulator with XRE-family HTH domain
MRASSASLAASLRLSKSFLCTSKDVFAYIRVPISAPKNEIAPPTRAPTNPARRLLAQWWKNQRVAHTKRFLLGSAERNQADCLSKTSLNCRRTPDRISLVFCRMSEADLKTTLREFKEYLALSYESPLTIAARIGVSQATVGDWLSGRHPPKAKSLAMLRRFLDTEAKRPAQGDGIRPVEPVPYKTTRPTSQVRYARVCPFCRKARGKIRKLGATSFQGTCPKCGASGPTREGHQEALRAWNGRE